MLNSAKLIIPIVGFLAIGLSAPATAADIDVNTSLKNFINANTALRTGILDQAAPSPNGVMKAADWVVTGINVSRMLDTSPQAATGGPFDTDLVTFNVKNIGRICGHQGTRYRSKILCLNAGAEIPSLASAYRGWNDQISSFSSTHGLWASYYQHMNYGGESGFLSVPVKEIGWLNNRTSSIKVGGLMEFELRYGDFKALLPAKQKRLYAQMREKSNSHPMAQKDVAEENDPPVKTQTITINYRTNRPAVNTGNRSVFITYR